jgi:hypothetical protein
MHRLIERLGALSEERTAGWYLREVTNGLLLGTWVLVLIVLASQSGNGLGGG